MRMIRVRLGLSLVALTLLAPAAERPAFEVAEIHRSGLALNPYTFISGGVLRGERYDLRKATMLDMIRIAYDVDPDAVFGGPNWLEFDRFDVAAKAPANTPPAAVHLMLQSLLSDRFKLVVHSDTRPMPAFALTTGSNKPKMQQSSGAADPECKYVGQPTGAVFVVYACRNLTMPAFAERLRSMAADYIPQPIANLTGLEGAYDFELRWNPRSRVLPAGTQRVTIFDAVDTQLGLSLVLKTSPAPVLVVDRVNEQPTADPPDTTRKMPRRETQFEVADLKPSRPGAPGDGMEVTRGGGLVARAMDMRVLMAAAWDIDWDHMERFAGLPKWVESARFDVNAKASVNTNAPPVLGAGFIDDDVRLMLRNLLIERFQIKWHYEDRPMTAYTLVAAKPKMKRGDPSHRASCKDGGLVENDPRDLNPILSALLVCQNVTMAQFASQLQPLAADDFGYPVEDATGLKGTWDFRVSFTPTWMLHLPQQTTGDKASDPTGALSITEAITRQLGVKLEQRKRMLPVVVIDHMEEKPLGN